MIVMVDYASPSVFESTRDRASLALATNRRRPVHFHGVVREHGFLLRVALRALGEAIWSSDVWVPDAEVLDPIITVHPDRLFFEAFSQDQSVYAALIVDPSLFDLVDKPVAGTTNIDFTAWLWGALGEMRSSRRTTFRIGAEGFEVRTHSAGGRFERKVDVPTNWVRGFLQVQGAMGLPGTRIDVQPIDLLAALRFLRYTKARVSPRALRYEFEPGQDAQLVLEPWEQVIPLVGATHSYSQRKVTRTWGRRRLKLIEGLLPFADSVQVYLKGRALPSFYAVQMAGMTFVLGLSGVSEAGFGGTGGFDLLGEASTGKDVRLPQLLDLLQREYHVSARDAALALDVDEATATQLLARLCRQGRVMFDVQSRRYRYRELFEQPINELEYFPPDLRRELAGKFLAEQRVRIESCSVEETRKIKRLKTPDGPIEREVVYRDWQVIGSVAEVPEARVTVGDNGSIVFGRCSCPFFQTNLMQQGPCEHLLALFQASQDKCLDGATSAAIIRPSPPRKPPLDEVDADHESDEE